ncbi:MAG: hypothetical protein ACP5HZ_12915, partial [Ferrimicrobium sp.]
DTPNLEGRFNVIKFAVLKKCLSIIAELPDSLLVVSRLTIPGSSRTLDHGCTQPWTTRSRNFG